MASIRSSIQLNDMVSSPLLRISNAVNMTVSNFEQMQRAMNGSVDTTAFESVRAELGRANLELNEMTNNINQSANSQNNLNNNVQKGSSFMGDLGKKVMAMVSAYALIQGAKSVIGISDELTQTTARLDMVNDGLQTTDELQKKIFQASERSRASYSDTANAVAQLGIRAKDAFSSNDEVIAFSETLNKMFTIAGASQQETSSATLQLTQALGSGVLRGEEFNAVFEAAPNVMQAVADYIGKPIGQLRNMASEGQITADIVKQAMFAAADETNAKFETMPATFGQVFTSFKNKALMVFQPVLNQLSTLANSPQFDAFVSNASTALYTVSIIVMNLFNLIGTIGTFISDNWSLIAPIIWGVVAALIVYNAALFLNNILTGTSIFTKIAHAVASAAETAAIIAMMIAQDGLNVALAACPLTWIIILIIAVIAAIYLGVAAFNKFAGTSISATGIILGVFSVLGNYILNTIGTMWNVWASFVEFFANVFTNPVYSVKALFVNLTTALLDMCISMTSGIDGFATNFANAIIGGVNDAIKALNWFIEMANKIPGLNLSTVSELSETSSITSTMGDIKGALQDWLGDKPEDYVTIPKWEMTNLDDAWDMGYETGEGIDQAVGDFDISSLFGGGAISDIKNNVPDYNNIANNTSGNSDVGDLGSSGVNADNISGIKDNTDSIKKSVDVSNEDLKYLRDLAEQETVNRFTTAEISVDMGGITNNVNSEIDLDGIVDYMVSGVNEAVEKIAEGVHD